MTRWIQFCAIPLSSLALAALLLAIIGFIRRPSPGRCPGARVSWLQFFNPWMWLFSRRCWYDLAGLPRDADGRTICPECGTRTAGMMLRRRRVRWELVACGLALAALTCWKARWIRFGGWIEYTPRTVLLLAERYGGHWLSDNYSERIIWRLRETSFTGWRRTMLRDAAIATLADDGVRWNSIWGVELLREMGDEALPALEAALDSPDWQQRILAAEILRRRCNDADPARTHPEDLKSLYNPPDQLFEVTVDSLRAKPWQAHPRWGWLPVETNRLRFLVERSDRSRAAVAAGLQSDDAQQRFLCAVAIGFMRAESLADAAAPILIEHLADNNSTGDARVAAGALYRLGPSIIPLLRAARDTLDTPDYQTGDLAQLLLLDLEHPGAPTADRKRLNHITTLAADPATDLGMFWQGADGMWLSGN